MKICVFGAGAVGGNLAVRLAEAGAEVSVVARGLQLAAIRERGISVTWQSRRVHAMPRATDDATTLGIQDAVIVTLKAPSLGAAAPAIASLLGPETPCVFAVNGLPWWYRPANGGGLAMLDPDGALARHVGWHRAVGGVLYVACAVTAPGETTLLGPVNGLVLGVPAGPVSARVRELVALFLAGGVSAEAAEDIRQPIWAKLALNLASSPLAVLGGAALPTLYAQPSLAAAATDLLRETAAIAAAEGIEAQVNPEFYLAQARALAHKPSMLQDLEAGRPMETAALLDAPLEVARRHGVVTPVLSLLAALIRVRAGQL